MPTLYPFDPTGLAATNSVPAEDHVLTAANHGDYNFIVPKFAPYFEDSVVLEMTGTDQIVRNLIKGVDWIPVYHYVGASRACAKPVFGGILFLDKTLRGIVRLKKYQTLGGTWIIDITQVLEELGVNLENPRVVTWEQISGVPEVFPVIDHEWDLTDMVGMKETTEAIDRVAVAILEKAKETPITDPFKEAVWTKEMLGLGKVGDYPMASDEEHVLGEIREAYCHPLGVSLAIKKGVTDALMLLKDYHLKNLPARFRSLSSVTGRAVTPSPMVKVTLTETEIAPTSWPISVDRIPRAPVKGVYDIVISGTISVNQTANQTIVLGVVARSMKSLRQRMIYPTGKNEFVISGCLELAEGEEIALSTSCEAGTNYHISAEVQCSLKLPLPA